MIDNQDAHVVILGGGFGGLAAAKALDVPGVRVTLIDRSNHHVFQPLLYQVASAALSAPDVSTPIRRLLARQRNATVLMGEVERIEVAEKIVTVGDTPVAYDYLVVATGATSAYFGNDRWAPHAPGLKTIGDALDVRRRILRAFEAAEMETSPVLRRARATFVVVGGGPTGVELAGALAEIATRTLPPEFRRFDPSTARVILVEAGPRILATFPEDLSRRAARDLEKIGVEVRTGMPVTDLGADFVRIGDEHIDTFTVLWAAGVRGSPLTAQLGAPLDRAGRVWVNDDLSVPERREIFVLGDLIAKTQDGAPLPGVAQLAIQSGRHAARAIRGDLKGKTRVPFRYVDKGSMATIGRNKAVAQIGRFRFAGFAAWLLWLTVHVLSLVEVRNRVAVIMEWAFAYFTWGRRSRLIVEVPPAPPPAESLLARVVGSDGWPR